MPLVTNRKAGFNYEILEKYTAGVELFGFEVKSLQGSHGSLEGAYVMIRGNEAFVAHMFVPPYQAGNTPKDYDPYRNRKLLLHKNEIYDLEKAEKTKGLTIIPISVYNKGGKIKADIAIVRGKKKFDKRQATKKRETERETRREFVDK
jgi:SsrA-binding protein